MHKIRRSVVKPFKSVLIPLGLTAAAAATGEAIHKKMCGSGMTTLLISNEKIHDIMEIVLSLEEPDLLIKGNREITKMKQKAEIWISQNEPRPNGVYSRNNLPKIKDWEYVINLDEYESRGTH